MTQATGRSTSSVHVLKVTLRDLRPPVWRRLEVPSTITLGQLHQVLQVAFDWSGEHLHDFTVRGIRYVPEGSGLFGGVFFGDPPRDEDGTRLDRVAPRPGDVLDYTYDLGDDWRHRIVVEAVRPASPGADRLACPGGSGLAPEEDTGADRGGQFDDLARHRVTAALRALRLTGTGLPLDDAPVDALFCAIFPELDVTGPQVCGCGCGHVVEEVQPVLPVLQPAPDAELAASAAGSALVGRALALAAWVGSGRALTPSLLLRPAEAVLAVAELGLDAPLLAAPGPDGAGSDPAGPDLAAPDLAGPDLAVGVSSAAPTSGVLPLFDLPPVPSPGRGRKLRSAKDLPALHPLWSACLAAGLIEIRGSKAYPGPGLRVWQQPGTDAERLENWSALLSGYLRARDDVARADRSYFAGVRGEALAAGIPLLYTLAQDAIPVAALSLALAGPDEDDDEASVPNLLRVPMLHAELSAAAEDWAIAGVLESTELPAEVRAELEARAVDLRQAVEGQLGDAAGTPGAVTRADHGVLLAAVLGAILPAMAHGPVVRLTPLGAYGLARLLTAHGWEVPRAGACRELPATDLLDRLTGYQPQDVPDEARAWIEARGEDWAAALEAVARSAAVKDELGPVRRAVLPGVLGAAGAAVAPVLDAVERDPWLTALVAAIRHGLGLGPEPTLAQRLWLAVDELSDALDDPDDFADAWQDADLAALLTEPQAVPTVVVCAHPCTREVLQAAVGLVEDAQVSRALRKALAGRSGNPALRRVGRGRRR